MVGMERYQVLYVLTEAKISRTRSIGLVETPGTVKYNPRVCGYMLVGIIKR